MWLTAAGEGEHARDARRSSHGENQSDRGAIAPAYEGGLRDAENVQHRQHFVRHQLVRERPSAQCASAAAAAVDENHTMAVVDERGKLVAPVFAVVERSVQHDDGSAGAEGGVPDLRALELDATLGAGGR